jgi:hypothetical protein
VKVDASRASEHAHADDGRRPGGVQPEERCHLQKSFSQRTFEHCGTPWGVLVGRPESQTQETVHHVLVVEAIALTLALAIGSNQRVTP